MLVFHIEKRGPEKRRNDKTSNNFLIDFKITQRSAVAPGYKLGLRQLTISLILLYSPVN